MAKIMTFGNKHIHKIMAKLVKRDQNIDNYALQFMIAPEVTLDLFSKRFSFRGIYLGNKV
jgi:hypothetical protein